jgi:hypothetical protein
MRTSVLGLALITLIFLLAGCGGGGGGVVGGVGGTAEPTAVTIIVKTVGSTATLYGVEFGFNLPAGVTLTRQASGELAAGVIVPSGGAAGASLVTNYQSTTSPQTVEVSLTKISGFPVGEFLTVTVMVAPGVVLQPANVTFSRFKAYDNLNGVPSDSITGTVTAP